MATDDDESSPEGVDFGELYQELRRVAGGALRSERAGHTLQPTALVHEVWLKINGAASTLEDREHVLALAARAMRQVLGDHARRRRSLKRGQRDEAADLDVVQVEVEGGAVGAVVLDDALSRLTELNERHGRIAELRLLAGLTIPEVARVLGLAQRTIEKDWRFARAWLESEFGEL